VYNFEVGKTLYHLTGGVKCIVREVLDKEIIIELEKAISSKFVLKLPKTHMGKWLFYSKYHIGLPYELLVNMENYQYGDSFIDAGIGGKNSAIERVLYSRKILYLVHFTKLGNLESILATGFLPRKLLNQYSLEYCQNDSVRLDGKTDCTCFSVEFPNCYLLRRFRNNDPRSTWVVILVDAQILTLHNESIYYCHNNAARSDLRPKLYGKHLNKVEAFEMMFQEEEHYVRSSGSGIKRRSSIPGIRSFLPTSEQAEILISGFIPSKFIKCVLFKTEEDRQQFNNELSPGFNCSHVEFEVNDLYFQYRHEVSFRERGD